MFASDRCPLISPFGPKTECEANHSTGSVVLEVGRPFLSHKSTPHTKEEEPHGASHVFFPFGQGREDNGRDSLILVDSPFF